MKVAAFVATPFVKVVDALNETPRFQSHLDSK